MKYEEYEKLMLDTHGALNHIKKDLATFLMEAWEDPEITEEEYQKLFLIAEEKYGYPL